MIRKNVMVTLLIIQTASAMNYLSGMGWKPLSEIDPNLTKTIAELVQAFNTLSQHVTAASSTLSTQVGTSSTTVAHSARDSAAIVTNNLKESILYVCQALQKATETAAEKGFKIMIDPQLNQSIQTIAEHGAKLSLDPEMNTSIKKIAQDGLKVIVDPALNENITRLTRDGLHAKLSIDSTTIKTICLTGIGTALAVTGILILYKELTQPIEHLPKEEAPKTYFERLTRFLKNPCLIGTAQLAAGLLLVVKANALLSQG